MALDRSYLIDDNKRKRVTVVEATCGARGQGGKRENDGGGSHRGRKGRGNVERERERNRASVNPSRKSSDAKVKYKCRGKRPGPMNQRAGQSLRGLRRGPTTKTRPRTAVARPRLSRFFPIVDQDREDRASKVRHPIDERSRSRALKSIERPSTPSRLPCAAGFV